MIRRRVEPPPAFGLTDVVGRACPLRGRPLRIVQPLKPRLRSLGHRRRGLAGCGHIPSLADTATSVERRREPTLALGLKLKQDGDLGLIRGLYALCPYIAGQWPTAENPSSTENNGIRLDLHNNRGAMGYGIEAFNDRNPLAWPSFATVDDVTGFPPTVISVNECDPLRDEGINFYRLLLQAGVAARGREVLGTMHGTETTITACPEISRDTARDLAAFARG